MKGNFLKKHKKAFIIGGVILLLLLFIFFMIYFIVPSFNDNNYGNRLANESKYKIQNTTVENIKSSIASEDGVKEVTYHKEGRILNFTIEVEDDVVLDTSKKYAELVAEKLSDKNLKFYDVQVFLKANSAKYPIIGYRSKGSDGFSWGNAGENK